MKQMGPGVEALPPAGHLRDEEIKKRADTLEAQIETLSKDVGAIDPTKLDPKKVEREVRQVSVMGDVPVPNAQSGYKYRWEYRDPSGKTGGRYMYDRLRQGWERVVGDMPEAREYKAVTGERWVADCLLMRIPEARYRELEHEDRVKRLRRHEGLTSNLRSMAAKAGVRVIDYSQPSGDEQRLVKTVKRVPPQGDMRKAFAHSVAKDQFDKALKEGSLQVPGEHNRR